MKNKSIACGLNPDAIFCWGWHILPRLHVSVTIVTWSSPFLFFNNGKWKFVELFEAVTKNMNEAIDQNIRKFCNNVFSTKEMFRFRLDLLSSFNHDLARRSPLHSAVNSSSFDKSWNCSRSDKNITSSLQFWLTTFKFYALVLNFYLGILKYIRCLYWLLKST